MLFRSVLTADGWGDGCNWSASIINDDGRLEQLDSGAGHVVARLYKWATLIMGMKPNEHEYKVMGLSGYSNYTSAIKAAEKILFEALDFRGGRIRLGPTPERFILRFEGSHGRRPIRCFCCSAPKLGDQPLYGMDATLASESRSPGGCVSRADCR